MKLKRAYFLSWIFSIHTLLGKFLRHPRLNIKHARSSFPISEHSLLLVRFVLLPPRTKHAIRRCRKNPPLSTQLFPALVTFSFFLKKLREIFLRKQPATAIKVIAFRPTDFSFVLCCFFLRSRNRFIAFHPEQKFRLQESLLFSACGWPSMTLFEGWVPPLSFSFRLAGHNDSGGKNNASSPYKTKKIVTRRAEREINASGLPCCLLSLLSVSWSKKFFLFISRKHRRNECVRE